MTPSRARVTATADAEESPRSSAKLLKNTKRAPVAQMDRAFASGARGRRFESCQAHQPQVFQEVAWLLDRYHMLTTICDKSKGSQTTNVCRNPRMRATCLC